MVETTEYRIPLSVTVSRKTGKVTRIEWCDNATREEFQRMMDWVKKAGEDAFRGAAEQT